MLQRGIRGYPNWSLVYSNAQNVSMKENKQIQPLQPLNTIGCCDVTEWYQGVSQLKAPLQPLNTIERCDVIEWYQGVSELGTGDCRYTPASRTAVRLITIV